jgi:hypothetical protein
MDRLIFLRLLFLLTVLGGSSLFSSSSSLTIGTSTSDPVIPQQLRFANQFSLPIRNFSCDFVTPQRSLSAILRFAIQYRRSMLKDGYREEFANEVFMAMFILYQSGIEDLLPQDISSVSDVVYAPEYIAMRKNIIDKLSQIMKDNGADYTIINRYLKGQQQDSWSDQSLAMKYFLFTQRKESDDFEKIYFWSGLNLGRLEIKHIQEVIKNVKNEANDKGLIFNIKKEKYAKTVAMYKALIALALNKAQIPGKIDHKKNVCIVQRGMKRADLIKFYPEYVKIDEGKIFTGTMKHGIADSVALGAPASEYTRPNEYDVIEMEVPFSRVLAAYFISPELSFDGPPYGISFDPSTRDNKVGKGSEHELICDMGNLPVKIRKKSTIEWFPTPSYAKARLRAYGYGFK